MAARLLLLAISGLEVALLDVDEGSLLDVDENALLCVVENESGEGGAASILSSLTRFLKGARLAISLRTCLARLMLKCPEPVVTFSIIICTIRALHSGLLAANSSTRLSIGVSQVLSLAAVGIVCCFECFYKWFDGFFMFEPAEQIDGRQASFASY